MNLLLARVANRKIDSGHHIRYQNNYYLPTEGSEDQYFTRGSKALVIEAFNGEIYVNIAEKIYTTRRLKEHDDYSTEFDPIPEQKKRKTPVYSPTISPVETRVFQKISSQHRKNTRRI